MPMKASGEDELREIDRYEDGVGWIAHPGETMQRASHALATDAGVLVADPVDAPGVDDLLASVGEVAAVAVLLDRHERDARAIAERHDVPVTAPAWMAGVQGRDGRPAPLSRVLADTTLEVHQLKNSSVWQEAALFDVAEGRLLVPEALGTAAYFRAGDERVGVHPFLRLTPPRSLRELDPTRLLVGHGAGLSSDVSQAVADAISGSRARTPRLLVDNVVGMFTG